MSSRRWVDVVIDHRLAGVALAAIVLACGTPHVDLSPRSRMPEAPSARSSTPSTRSEAEVERSEQTKEANRPLRGRCKMNHLSILWLQTIIDAWGLVQTEIGLLETDVGLPWMIVYDGFCQWNVGSPPEFETPGMRPAGALAWRGRPIPVVGAPHRGTLVLPDSRRIPARAMAFASAHQGRSFFVLAQRSLWLEDFEDAKGEDLDRFFAGVAVHELVHTQQILKVQAQVSVLHAYSSGMPQHINDDSLTEVFTNESEYADALANERELLHRAMLAQDPLERMGFARRALESICQRRERFHVGERAWASKVEDLLLSMEGMAVWVHLQASKRMTEISATPRPVTASPDQLAVHLAERSVEYVQDAGFSMTYLVDVLAPDWPRRGAFQLLQSPVRLLEVAIRGRQTRSVGHWFGPPCRNAEPEKPLIPPGDESLEPEVVTTHPPR